MNSMFLRVKRVLSEMFFSPKRDSFPADRPKWQHYILLVLIFIVTRALILLFFEFRGTGILLFDAHSYLGLARYLKEHHFLLPYSGGIAKQFPGLPLLIALLDGIIHNTLISGFIVSWLGSLGSALLFLYVFGDLRMAILYTVFIPHWVSYSASVSNEGLSIFFYMICLATLRPENKWPLKALMLITSGFAMVVRPTTAFVIYPCILLAPLSRKQPRDLFYKLCLVSIAPAGYLLWNYLSSGLIFLQVGPQLARFKYYVGGYPARLLSWPGQSMISGLLDKNIVVAKKIYVALHIVILSVAIRNLIKDTHAGNKSAWALPFLVSTLAYSGFILFVGSKAGFSCFERYLLVQINPLIIYALFHSRPLRWIWVFALAVVSVLAGSLIGIGKFVRL